MEQYTVIEAASRLGVTDRALHKALRTGRLLYARKVGRNYLIDADALEAYRTRTQPGGSPSKGRPVTVSRKRASLTPEQRERQRQAQLARQERERAERSALGLDTSVPSDV